MSKRKLLLLIDGNALIHRAYHALPPLTVNRTGEMVNAVYGFANTLLRVVTDHKPTHWAIAFDYPAPTFRHEAYAEYKAHRPATPEELKGQIVRVHELAEALGMPSFELKGYEADDILGTLSEQARKAGIGVSILTGDRDLLQLVRPGVSVLLPGRTFSEARAYDDQAVRERFGVRPEQLPVYKALVGDPSDNIPGVPGIGEKTAVKLVTQYGDLENILEHAPETPPKVRDSLTASREQLKLSEKLATILLDAPVRLNIEECVIGEYDLSRVQELFQELEFTRLLNRLPSIIPGNGNTTCPPTATSRLRPAVLSTARERTEAAEALVEEDELVFAVFTGGAGGGRQRRSGGVSRNGINIRGLAISTPQQTFYIPIESLPEGAKGQLPLEQPLEFLRPIAEAPAITKICDDAKPVIRFLSAHHLTLRSLSFDTSVAAHLVGEKSVGLTALAFNRLGFSLADNPPNGGSEPQAVAEWLAEQAHACRLLRDNLAAEIAEKDMDHLFKDVELPLISVLARMEDNGILLDTETLYAMSRTMSKEIARLEELIYKAAGHSFNLNSPQQLGNVLFREMGIPGGKRTKSGYSTEASLLEALRCDYEIIDLVLQYRQLAKLKSTYVDTLPRLVNPRTGRLHTTFTQTGTATGRLSSSEPNLQNLPIRTEQGRLIRQAIIAPRGSVLLSADYSQIDLRALAHLSQDEGLLRAFLTNEDIHTTTASTIFGVPPENVTPDMRRAAKVVNFGIVYGMSDYGLEQATSFSRAEATTFIKAYFEQYPGVYRWLEETKQFARTNGYVKTLLGRRRPIPEITSPNRQIREAAERMAINAPVQGTSADIIKIAMLRIDEALEKHHPRTRMVLQIHDELLFEVPEVEVGDIKNLVRDLMQRAVELSVPLKVELKAGPNWAEMYPLS